MAYYIGHDPPEHHGYAHDAYLKPDTFGSDQTTTCPTTPRSAEPTPRMHYPPYGCAPVIGAQPVLVPVNPPFRARIADDDSCSERNSNLDSEYGISDRQICEAALIHQFRCGEAERVRQAEASCGPPGNWGQCWTARGPETSEIRVQQSRRRGFASCDWQPCIERKRPDRQPPPTRAYHGRPVGFMMDGPDYAAGSQREPPPRSPHGERRRHERECSQCSLMDCDEFEDDRKHEQKVSHVPHRSYRS
eukprot:gnl/TRDRNA2_/TRDRNA2_83022_c0_seq1.p1 gnl/TRDRNA2_/TRDRNA2_83022_c0~~gnl/TRDRNA2_/TRDRNA2_83022_c0_seq1.p1  ORF type:complete len:247 (-),score=16.05 gnl/TRDRNA2_/TRDRNA2_83022_c0_seq1:149-889(-)